MGRQAKLKQQRKLQPPQPTPESTTAQPQALGDVERMTYLGYGEHNRLRSPDIPEDRPEPRL